MALAVGLALASCGGGDGAAANGAGEDEYLRANDRLVDALPRFPGAQEVTRESAPYFVDDHADAEPAGFTTRVVYELPRRVPQRTVVDFYVERLPGWRSQVDYAPGVDVATGESRPGAWSATFRRGRSLVGLNTDNLIAPAGRRFEVTVDHHGGRA